MPVGQLEIPGELVHLGWLKGQGTLTESGYFIEWQHTHKGARHALRFCSNEYDWANGFQAKELEDYAIRSLNIRKEYFDKLFS